MRDAVVTPEGDRIRWAELPGAGPPASICTASAPPRPPTSPGPPRTRSWRAAVPCSRTCSDQQQRPAHRLPVHDAAGAHWWSTVRLAGPEALHRSAVHLARGSEPVVRELLVRLPMPRTFLLPADDGPLTGAEALVAAGMRGGRRCRTAGTTSCWAPRRRTEA